MVYPLTATSPLPALDPRAGKRVLVTGGASGLGAAVARAVAEAGGRPAILDVNLPMNTAAANGPAGEDWTAVAPAFQADVTDRAAVERAVEAAAQALGGLDAVVTAAGIDRCGRLDEVPADAWERVVAVNLLGTVSTVRAALPHLFASHGRVVTIASTLALRGVSDATAYCASKFGVVGFSRALAAETAGKVGVTTVVPGGMDTRFFDDRSAQYRPADNSRLNDPANVARAILFALSQPEGCELRELLICHEAEDSWP